MMCATGLLWANVQAQVLFPQVDLYDTGAMMSYINAVRSTAAARMENYYYYTDLAIDAFNNQQWGRVIDCVNSALSTYYESGMLFFMRGYAYEALGRLRDARKDYKTARKMNYADANDALLRVERRLKESK